MIYFPSYISPCKDHQCQVKKMSDSLSSGAPLFWCRGWKHIDGNTSAHWAQYQKTWNKVHKVVFLKVRQISANDWYFIIWWWQWPWLCQVYILCSCPDLCYSEPGLLTTTWPEVKKCYLSQPAKCKWLAFTNSLIYPFSGLVDLLNNLILTFLRLIKKIQKSAIVIFVRLVWVKNITFVKCIFIVPFARLGRLTPGGSKGPGIFFVLPCIEK